MYVGMTLQHVAAMFSNLFVPYVWMHASVGCCLPQGSLIQLFYEFNELLMHVRVISCHFHSWSTLQVLKHSILICWCTMTRIDVVRPCMQYIPSPFGMTKVIYLFLLYSLQWNDSACYKANVLKMDFVNTQCFGSRYIQNLLNYRNGKALLL